MHIILGGFCTLSTAVHLESFDTQRFGPLGPDHPSVIEGRIEQAFLAQQPNRAHAAIQNIIDQSALPSVLFPDPKPVPKPTPKAEPPVVAEKPEPKAEEPVATEKARSEEKSKKKKREIASSRSENRQTAGKEERSERSRATVSNRKKYRKRDGSRKYAVFWPFKSYKKSSKIPEGVNIDSKGYKAVHKAALKHGVDVNFALRVAKQESRGNCNATSHANAKGVMQVIPGTARKHGVTRASTLYNCTIGADVGVRELKSCLKVARGNRVQALVCYNAGPAWITSTRYRGRRIPAETRKYIKIITGKTVAKVT